MYKVLISFFVVVLTSLSLSKSVSNELEISGFIIDKTISRFGKIYFSNISSRWEEHEQLGNYSISIEERYTPQIGSLVVIRLNGEMVMQLTLGRKEDIIIEHSKNTVKFLINSLLERKFPISNPDLARSGL